MAEPFSELAWLKILYLFLARYLLLAFLMKKHSSFIFLGLLLSLTAGTSEAAPVRVSVTRFSQEVDHLIENCRGWSFSHTDALRTELERAMVLKGLKVLERRSIRGILEDEHRLPNANSKFLPRRQQFISAQYTITAGITELGICEESERSTVQLGGIIAMLGGPSDSSLGVGNRKVVSKVKLVAQVVSVETGEMLQSFSAESEISENGYSVEGGARGVEMGRKVRNAPPIERAVNQAIKDIADQIAEFVGR